MAVRLPLSTALLLPNDIAQLPRPDIHTRAARPPRALHAVGARLESCMGFGPSSRVTSRGACRAVLHREGGRPGPDTSQVTPGIQTVRAHSPLGECVLGGHRARAQRGCPRLRVPLTSADARDCGFCRQPFSCTSCCCAPTEPEGVDETLKLQQVRVPTPPLPHSFGDERRARLSESVVRMGGRSGMMQPSPA